MCWDDAPMWINIDIRQGDYHWTQPLMSSYSTEDERLQLLAPETGSRFLICVIFKATRVKC